MFQLCLMASTGYPSALVLHHSSSTPIKDSHPFFSVCGPRRETPIGLRNIQPQQTHVPWTHQLLDLDLKLPTPKMLDAQDNHTDSLLFSSTFDEQFQRCNHVLEFLVPSPSEENNNKRALDLPHLRGLQEMKTHHKGLFASSLFFPASEFDAHLPVRDFVSELISSSKITIHPDGQILFTQTGTEIKDLLSIVAEFYLSNNSLSWRKHSILVPNYVSNSTEAVYHPCIRTNIFSFYIHDVGVLNGGVGSHVYDPPVKLHATTIAPMKSPDTVKVKPSRKRRMGKKVGRERDLYKRNYFHACESLLSYMFNKQQHGKRAILCLKNCGRELPELLTQLSAGIAGTGLVVILSVMCKLAWGRVPFCSSQLLNTGFGVGLVWLSCAVNKLRDTIICISKKPGKVGLKEDEMTRRVDKTVNEIFFRTAAIMTVAILRIG